MEVDEKLLLIGSAELNRPTEENLTKEVESICKLYMVRC